MISGSNDEVKDFLRRGKELRDGDDNPLKRVIGRVGHGFVVVAVRDCGGDFRACDSRAISVSGEDDYLAEVTLAFLFRNERAAKSSVRDVDNILADALDHIPSFDYEEVDADGEFIVVKSSVDADDLESLMDSLP